MSKLKKYIRRCLDRAEWRGKVVYYVDGPSVQHYAVTLLLPVPVDAKDKSPDAAFKRFLDEL